MIRTTRSSTKSNRGLHRRSRNCKKLARNERIKRRRCRINRQCEKAAVYRNYWRSRKGRNGFV